MNGFLMCSLSKRCDILPDVLYSTCTVQRVSAKTDKQSYFYPQVKANVMVINIVACHLCSRTQVKGELSVNILY